MPNTNLYNQSEAVQRTVNQLMREEYMPDIPELLFKVGSPTSRLMKPAEKLAYAANGGLIQRVKTNRANSGRTSKDLLADFAKGRTSKAAKVKLRLDYDTPADNDFVSVEAATTIPWHDFVTGGTDIAESVLSDAQTDVMDSIDYTRSVLMHSDVTGAIGAINGTPKNDFDAEGTYAGASTYTSGQTDASFLVDGHTIGIFREGVHLDIYNGATLLADEVRIDKVNFEEGSLSVELGDLATATTMNDLADNATIYLAGTKDSGFKCSFGEMFKTTYASDSWIGGIDRAASGNRHWIPIRTRTAATSPMPMTKQYLDTAARSMGWRTAENIGQAPVFIAGTEIIDNFRSDVGDSALVNEGANDRGSYTIGEVSLAYQHPVLGKLNLMGDYTAKNDRGYLVFPEDLELYSAEMKGPVIMSEGTSGRGFERAAGATPSTGGSKFYKLEVMEQIAPFFKAINRSSCIFNVS